MIESITWYLRNTKKTLPKFQENIIYIYIGNYEYILYILSLQVETVTHNSTIPDLLQVMCYNHVEENLFVVVRANKPW